MTNEQDSNLCSVGLKHFIALPGATDEAECLVIDPSPV